MIKYQKYEGIIVEVVSRGHFPTTIMVKTPDGRTLEVEQTSLSSV
jgi:hypothetical protein